MSTLPGTACDIRREEAPAVADPGCPVCREAFPGTSGADDSPDEFVD
ncbi:MAG TPA: hypothetical protein VMY05_01740 [Acidobacteriota bacterium]|nr:hypothetical protein [Acidobacteriota bacterium]